MPKRVHFNEEEISATKSARIAKSELEIPEFKAKEQDIPNVGPDSDSDEEVEGAKKKEEYEKLTEEDVEGAEDDYENSAYDDVGPQITPFNLKEEMEEGDFDKQGHYHFKKDKEVHDNWLDNIDWVNVKKQKENMDLNNSSSDEEQLPFDEVKVMKEIVSLLNQGESVTRGLRRLGGSDDKKKKKGGRNWQREKVYDMEAKDDESSKKDPSDLKHEAELKKSQFIQLTELADQMAGAGHYDIYTDTFEKIQFKLNSLTVSKEASIDIPEDADDDDALDMFGSNIDSNATKHRTERTNDNSSGETEEDNSVKWEYKWDEKETELFGPFTTQQMADWKEQGFFKNEVQVRRTDTENAPFYSARRVDFDLYD